MSVEYIPKYGKVFQRISSNSNMEYVLRMQLHVHRQSLKKECRDSTNVRVEGATHFTRPYYVLVGPYDLFSALLLNL